MSSYNENEFAADVDMFCLARRPCASIFVRLADPDDPKDHGVQMVTHTSKELPQDQVMSLLMGLKLGYQLVAQSVADQTGTNVHTLDQRIDEMISASKMRFGQR